jgi:2-polyprenyl-3-methyl-5-hydroxy-6-metoxy-1,4-benzoquinol methylase/spore coat polysaccharide biosynthesis predicted glycosyltransferase SpsG
MSILLVPELRSGHGTGHLRRARRLLDTVPESLLFVTNPPDSFHDLLADIPSQRITTQIDGSDCIVCDRFHLSLEECRAFRIHAPVIGVDVGGPGRAECDFLIDTLPRPGSETANIVAPGADAKTITQRLDATGRDRVLLTFGGEDPAHLTERALSALADSDLVAREAITVVRPALRELDLPDWVRVLEPQDGLEEQLAHHEFVITSFGLTAFEARTIGCRVLLINPSGYHEKLARLAQFESAGTNRISKAAMRRFFARTVETASNDEPGLTGHGSRSLTDILTALRAPALLHCPVDGHDGSVVHRTENRTYRRCAHCGLVFMQRFAGEEMSYGPEYFMDEYAAQYGRTYIEDFAHIKSMGRARMSSIEALTPPGKRLLDIGCAYGPFLSAADDCGYEVCGTDISEEPTRYVREVLELPAFAGDIRDPELRRTLPHEQFDVVTLWYVIEHFPDLGDVLAAVVDLLAPGGVLALATPYGGGVSARRTPETFYEQSPRDHFSIWDRCSSRRVLSLHGMAVERFVSTGHHPERYPMVARGALPRKVAAVHSRIAGWGDTFEIYARKMPKGASR